MKADVAKAEIVVRLLEKYARQVKPPDAIINYWGIGGVSFEIKVDRAWGIGASMDVKSNHKGTIDILLGWSSTLRTPMQAYAAASLYHTLAELAITLQVKADDWMGLKIEELKKMEASQ